MTAKKPRKRAPARDPLKGFRGERPEQLRAAAQRRQEEGEPELPEDSPYKKYILGVTAERLIAGLGEAGDAERIVHDIIKRAEAECQMHIKAVLANPDPGSESARAAHFEARVMAGILTMLNDIVRSGIEAGRLLEDGDTEV